MTPATGPRPRPAAAGRWSLLALCAIAAILVAVIALAGAQASSAAGAPPPDPAPAPDPRANPGLGQTPSGLAWIELEDSRGISIWNYELGIDRGGVTDPASFIWSAITDSAWQGYRSFTALALWFLDWVLSFAWLPVIAAPLLTVGEAMTAVVARIGIVPTLLVLAAIIAGGWILRGRYATGIWELAMTLVIAALASGIFASPVALIAGDDGAIIAVQRAGVELSAQLAGIDTENMSPSALRAEQSAVLVDTFIRQPTQMINFGSVLDAGPCAGAYDAALREGPYGYDDDTLRTKVADCDAAAGDYAGAPSPAMALGAVIFGPASLVIFAMALIVAGSVIAAGCYAIYAALKAIVTFVTGLLPGGGRGSLFLTIAEAGISLVIVLFTTIFLSIYLLVIRAIFAAGAGAPIARTFVIVDVVLLVGIIVFLNQRKRLTAAQERLAGWMAQRPGGAGATRMPERTSSGAGAAVSGLARTGMRVAQLHATRSASSRGAGATYIDARRQAAFFTAGTPGGEDGADAGFIPSRSPGGQGEGGPGPMLPGPRKPLPGPGPAMARIESRKKKVTGALVRAGVGAGLGALTGGGSTALSATSTAARAARAATSARRVALTARMASATASAATKPASASSPRAPGGTSPAPMPTASLPRSGRPTRPSGDVLAGEVLRSTARTAAPTARPPAAPSAAAPTTTTRSPRERRGARRPAPAQATGGRQSGAPGGERAAEPQTSPAAPPRSGAPARPAATSPRQEPTGPPPAQQGATSTRAQSAGAQARRRQWQVTPGGELTPTPASSDQPPRATGRPAGSPGAPRRR